MRIRVRFPKRSRVAGIPLGNVPGCVEERLKVMKTRIICIALLALAAGIGGACGDDDSASTPNAGAGGAGAAGGSGGASGAAGGHPVFCLKEVCKKVDGVDGEPCCMDAFAGGCGIMSGGSCGKPPDKRCPPPDLGMGMGMGMGGFSVAGCCSSGNECGVDIGMGCMSRSSLCQFVPKSLASMINPISCDGTPLELPADCGTDMTGFPGGPGMGPGADAGI
jgi:hypothetical protein